MQFKSNLFAAYSAGNNNVVTSASHFCAEEERVQTVTNVIRYPFITNLYSSVPQRVTLSSIHATVHSNRGASKGGMCRILLEIHAKK